MKNKIKPRALLGQLAKHFKRIPLPRGKAIPLPQPLGAILGECQGCRRPIYRQRMLCAIGQGGKAKPAHMRKHIQ